MINKAISSAQHHAAKVVGVCYLVAMVAAVFAESYARDTLIVANDAAETARNIVAHEHLWRVGIASNLLCLIADTALIAALYTILNKVNPHLAMFAVCTRVIETAVAGASTLNSFEVLRWLSRAEYLKSFDPTQLSVLARIHVSAYSPGINVGFIFLGIGSAVFGWLWYRSRYIPAGLAILGMVGSALLAIGSFVIVVFPSLANVLGMIYMLPLGVFEISIALLLILKGLSTPVPQEISL
jgi:hypothetical protein